ncbi:MFS transporter [Metabacillus sp. RGM 3146]|uniref:MFS transporter n=1 Tax=Metabacillus sp. RGM 3146 TaxID=3401092 RepID=UPI003B9A781C
MITLIIGMLPFLMVLGNSMLIPLLPQYEGELNLTSPQASIILSIFSIPAALIIPFAGFLSDRYGRRKLILISMAVITIGALLCILSGFINKGAAYHTLLAGRFIQGLGTGGTTPLAMALIGDVFIGEERSRQLGILEGFNGFAKVVAPIAGAVLALFSWYAPFFIFPVIGVLTGAGIFLLIKKAPSGDKTIKFNDYLSNIGKVVKREKGWLFAAYLYGGTGLFLLYGLLYYLAYLIEETYHIDGFFKGFSFAFPLISMTITSYWTGRKIKTDHHLMKQYLAVGSLMMFVSFMCVIVFQNFSFLLFFLTVGFGGLGFILPCINTFITSSVKDSERGFVVGLYGLARFSGVALGPIVYSVWMNTPEQMFLYSFILLAFSQALFWISFYRKKIQQLLSAKFS